MKSLNRPVMLELAAVPQLATALVQHLCDLASRMFVSAGAFAIDLHAASVRLLASAVKSARRGLLESRAWLTRIAADSVPILLRLRHLAAAGLSALSSFMTHMGLIISRVVTSAIVLAKRLFSVSRAYISGVTVNTSGVLPLFDRLRARLMANDGATLLARGAERANSREGLGEEHVSRHSSHTIAHDLAAVLPAPRGTPLHHLRFLALSAFAIVGVFIIGFGVWAVFAPLESAAIAGGAIEAESSRKTIQHLEGGIVSRILINDGDHVSAGQPLIHLDDTKAHASVQVLQMQLWDAQALEARLLAERGGRSTIQFPLTIRPAAHNEPALAELIAGQIKIFDTRRNLQASRIDVIQQRKAQTEQEIAGLRFQVEATRKRAAIIRDEIAVVAPLVAKRLQARSRLSQLEREQAEIDGRLGDKLAQISQAEQSIGESKAMILQLESDHNTEIAQSLRDTRAQIFELLERVQAASDVLARTVVRAPEAGTITDLRIHTPGGVIAAGEPLLDLVPSQDRLIVRVQVKPEDIDLVRPGLDARIRLLSYKHRRVPPVDGVLTYVSADRLVDKGTERTFYTARIRINEASLRSLPEVQIMPGMPVEVLIKTGQFTVAHYALRPVFDSFNRAFRED